MERERKAGSVSKRAPHRKCIFWLRFRSQLKLNNSQIKHTTKRLTRTKSGSKIEVRVKEEAYIGGLDGWLMFVATFRMSSAVPRVGPAEWGKREFRIYASREAFKQK
jgi:hypothetical protein